MVIQIGEGGASRGVGRVGAMIIHVEAKGMRGVIWVALLAVAKS